MKKTLLSAGTALCLVTAPAHAADNDAIAKQLAAMQAQLAAMQEQVTRLSTELEQAKARAASAEQSAAASAEQARVAALAPAAGKTVTPAKPKEPAGDEVKVSLSPGPKFETADGNFMIKLGGFGQVDAGVFDNDVRDHPDGTNIRRARLNVSGTIYKDWKFKIENDFAGNASTLTDVYLEYAGFEGLSLMAGQFKEPFALDNLNSDLHTTFMERAAPATTFAPDRNIGFAATVNGETGIGYYTASAGVFGASAGTASTDDESRGFTGRLTLAPIATGTEVLHFGVAASHRIPDAASDSVRLQSRPESRLTSSQAVDTGNITAVDDLNLVGLELAGVYGPLHVQAEYIREEIQRNGAFADATMSGYYAEAGYFLTGESRTYNKAGARFDRTKPKWPFSLKGDGWGAWQVAARYSSLDLTDVPVSGGEMKNITFGIKWLPTAYTMLSANYIMVDTDNRSVTANDDPNIFMMRAQFDF